MDHSSFPFTRKRPGNRYGRYFILFPLQLILFFATTPGNPYWLPVKKLLLENSIEPTDLYIIKNASGSSSFRIDLLLERPLTSIDYILQIAEVSHKPDWPLLLNQQPISEVYPASIKNLTELIGFLEAYDQDMNQILQKLHQKILSHLPSDYLEYWTRHIFNQNPGTQSLIEQERMDSLYFSILDSISNRELVQPLYKALKLIGLMEQKKITFKIKNSPQTIDYPQGRVVIGTLGDDIYTEPVWLIIDPGGNDRYSFSRGMPMFHNQFIIDIQGNDEYNGSRELSLNAAYMNSNILIDLAGDDHYTAESASIGSALMGNCVLYDGMGNDTYQIEKYGQSFAFLGNAILWDRQGNDHYQGGCFIQASAFPQGLAILLDQDGDDEYISQGIQPDIRDTSAYDTFGQGYGMGFRPWCHGGCGMLIDINGNDYYWGSYFAQGCGYWKSVGILIDKTGDDQYQARRYAQGAGIHLAAGLLLDQDGNDSYQSWGVSQGCGYDYALGCLIDENGSDDYRAEWYSMAAADKNGCGILIDTKGSNQFITLQANCLAFADTARATCSFSLFLYDSLFSQCISQPHTPRAIGLGYEK